MTACLGCFFPCGLCDPDRGRLERRSVDDVLGVREPAPIGEEKRWFYQLWLLEQPVASRDQQLGLAVRFVRTWRPCYDRSWVSRFDVYAIGDRVVNISWGYWFYPDRLAKLLDPSEPWLR